MEKDIMFKIFRNEELGRVRTCYDTVTGSAWFVAKDVCDILEIKNSRDAVSRLLDDEKTTIVIGDEGSNYRHQQTLVSESGLYMLVLRSRKPSAEAFQRWITRDVLKSIRKYGAYIMGQEDLPESERDAMLKKVATWQNDSNFWFERYHKLLDEYIDISSKFIASGEYTRKNNGGIEGPKEGFIAREDIVDDDEVTWTDDQCFVQTIEEGSKYAIVDREMR